MKLVLPVLLLCCFCNHLFAAPAGDDDKVIKVTGKILDKSNNSAISGALIQIVSDTSSSNNFTAYAVADNEGRFVVDSMPYAKKYIMIISAVGYGSESKALVFNDETGRSMIVKNVEAIAMAPEANTLANVVVTATAKPAMQFGIDRKIFNVEKSITAQGGTAVDVMRNIPSITVDVNGNVQMRNSSPQILVDGRPTILTLDQIPADDIERVELLTNPSSKFDASSAGGIVNVVLKKNKRKGFNGLASVGGGTPQVLNGNLSLNLRQKSFNFFASGNYNQSGGIARGEAYRENKSNNVITDYFTQVSENERKRKFNSVRFGADYFIDDKSTISFTQGITNGRFNNTELQDQQYFDQQFILDYTGTRLSEGSTKFQRSSSVLAFDRTFNRPDHKLTADITYNKGSRTSGTQINTILLDTDGSPYAPDTRVRNEGSGDDDQLTIQLDYSNQVNENKKIEFGLRSFTSNSTTTFATYAQNGNSETKLPLSNNYKYRETVNAGYFNYANKWKTFKYQLGLRTELSKLDGQLLDSNTHFGYAYPASFKNLLDGLFPSLFLTKELDANQELQFNYSRRIRRPRFWEVNPFVDIDDPLNISQGNPGLMPEFTHSFEVNYFNKMKNGSFLGVVYFRNNIGDVTEYSDTISAELYDKLNNAAVSPNAILSTFINAGYTNRLGTEFTLQQKFFKNLDLTYSINLMYRKTSADVKGINLSNAGFNYDTKFIANYKIVSDRSKLFNNLSFQLLSEFESPEVIPQGRRKSQFVTDFALRKEMLKNKAAALSFSINDVFNTRRYGTIYDTDDFYQDSYNRWNVRTFRLTFSYKFGSSDFDLFKRRESNDAGGGQEG
ncbi:TonB-dependent receptor [Panacibacter sp. DH6]|uniref:TonB-dependent receptor n=1 Tax=Panacibacter microcysteis TaxID=2793269 RepID=A0A931E8D8_9BACT|nr:outer membrane beta-barrel family protein [Panacibacter microcysteis]MBG9377003.1 TonB-dependent receptor [Panacibacter microcysteis]